MHIVIGLSGFLLNLQSLSFAAPNFEPQLELAIAIHVEWSMP
jgi:hypothetical protein